MGTFEFFYRVTFESDCTNNEATDMDNPRGEVYGDVYQIIAERPDGTRYIVGIDTKDEAQAKRQVTKFTDRGSVPMKHLFETDPAYGSRAYQALDATGYFYEMERKDEQFAM